MFKRGQKIEVVEYYGTKRTRPKVGDVGYLSNMFLYPKEKFILADAVFFRYACDNSNSRFEHKRFIIDIGMDKKLKYKIVNTGVKKLFFMDTPHINLNPIIYSRNSGMSRASNTIISEKDRKFYTRYGWTINHAYPKVVGSFGVWSSNKTKGYKENKHIVVKLPCVKIKPYIGKITTLDDRDNTNLLRAWCITVGMPLTILMYSIETRAEHSMSANTNGGRSVFHLAGSLYETFTHLFSHKTRISGSGNTIPSIELGKDFGKYFTGSELYATIKSLRKLESYHNMFMARLNIGTTSFLKHTEIETTQIFINDSNESGINKPFWAANMEKMRLPKLYDMLTNVFFRALISPDVPESMLDVFRDLPISKGKVLLLDNNTIKEIKTMAAFDNSLLKNVLQ